MSLQQQYENYLKRNKHRPVKRIQWRGVEIYLSEGGPFYPDEFPLENRAQVKDDFPLGFYEATYAVGVGDQIIFWQPLLFDRLHDAQYTDSSREQARVNAALKQAQEVIMEQEWLKDSISH